MPATDPVTPDPRRFSIRLPRPLWIGVAAVVLSAVEVGVQFGLPIYRQQAAMREFKRIGGHVITRHVGPEWLRQFLGDERMKLFDDAYFVNLQDKEVDDSGLALLASLRRLEYLNLRRTAITGGGLIHLRQATRLESLGLGQTRVGDADLVILTQMKNLTLLDLSDTLVTDAGMQY